ncbi:MAG: CRISPR-associated helicase Cas3' [Thermoproteota archaeon]
MEISSYFELYSHPNKPLYEHLSEVAEISRRIVQEKEFNGKLFDKSLLSEVTYIIGFSHDFGKATKAFQEHLLNKKSTELAYHSQISSLFTYYSVREYLKNNGINDALLPFIAWMIVFRHHGDLYSPLGAEGMIETLRNKSSLVEKQIEDIKRNSFEPVKKIYHELKFLSIEDFISDWKKIIRDLKDFSHCISGDLSNYFLSIYLYSVLLDADKLSASKLRKLPERVSIADNLVDNYKAKTFFISNEFSNIIKLRSEAYKEIMIKLNKLDVAKDRILSIELPTGSGKTLAAFSFALKLRNKVSKEYGFIPKIIYCLPFLSIIDQNSKIIRDVLSMGYKDIPSNLMLTHHHLSDIYYKLKDDSELEHSLKDPLKASLLIEGWHSEIVITTFVQFFHSLITNKNRSARKFHNMTNSIILLDEVQAIPRKYWDVVAESLKLLAKEYNSWIILMTATMPLIFKEGEINALVEDKNYYYNTLNRVEYRFDLEEKSVDEFNKYVTDDILRDNKDIMVVHNTIWASKKTYKYIKEKLIDKYGNPHISEEGIASFPGINLIYLSSNVIPKHRQKRIEAMKSKVRKIIVSTQVVEAGVDISVNKVYRDFAPIDSIVQTAGRCNRNSESNMGVVNIFLLYDKRNNEKIYPSYQIYDPILLDVTRRLIKDYKIIQEKDFNMSIIPKYYNEVRSKSSPSVRCPSVSDSPIDLVKSVEKLDFTVIEKCFKLIEEEPWKTDVFVEIDEHAKNIFNNFRKILEIENFEDRQRAFLSIRKDLFDYVISINKSMLLSSKELGGLITIGEENYDRETGFRGKDGFEDTTIII